MTEIFSRILSCSLDHLGYNDGMIKFRRESWKYAFEVINKDVNKKVRQIIAGSKAEGITLMHESDIDIVTLDRRVLCLSSIDQIGGISQLPDDIIVLLAEMENAPAGYTRLKLYRPSSFRKIRQKIILESLFQSQSGDVLLSSTLFTNEVKKSCEHEDKGKYILHDVTGPAVPTSGRCLDADNVLGFTFHCPQLLHTWASRPRHHDWPSQNTIQTACSFLPQVVPVGAKGSDRQFQEWRLCFIESELTLTHSFNGTQTKLYTLLKMIAKNILKQITGEISSYMMKNITYWLSELLPLNVFKEEKLISLVLLGLLFLRTAVSRWHNLPYYMIPARNLLSERLDAPTQRKLSIVLKEMLVEGPRLFLRIEKLRKCLETALHAPSHIVRYGNLRDQLEKSVLALLVLSIITKRGTYLDESIKARLMASGMSSFSSCVCLLDPSRQGAFRSGDSVQTFNRILS